MKKDESTSRAEPQNLDRLLALGLDSESHGIALTASFGHVIEKPGGQIDRYKLLNILGEGGMGVVYLAEQKHPIRRQVALKVIKPGMDSKRVVARFEAERQALALLDHASIAHVHDAATTETGRPYFVMEYVKGLPITEHCDHYKLAIEQRLRLFQQVCQAVQHAHQKGIIHRDIKPSNILVSVEDNRPTPKIIDFGVAKALSMPLTERTLATEDTQLLGTPEYMSPEQADMANKDIDTRSDIYSLGVLLYVLLTGVLPFDSDTLREGGIDNIRKTIRETDPKTPSTRLTGLGEEAKKVAEDRRTEIGILAKCLHRELEWIPLKAMRKERSDRYRSASELADDIENYLKGDPLLAGPPSACYRLKKSLYRNKALVSGIAAVLIVSAVGAIASVIFALGQAKARAQQARAFAENEATTLFLRYYILEPLGQATAPSVRQVFDNALKTLGSRLAEYPRSEAELRFNVGKLYLYRFGTYDVALSNLERAVELEPTIAYQNWLALAYNTVGRYADAESLFKGYVERAEEAIAQGKRVPNDFFWILKHHLAKTYHLMGRYDEAERHLREAEHYLREITHEKWFYWQEFTYKGMLPDLLRDRGRYEEARRLYGDLLEKLREAPGKQDLSIVKGLGILYTREGNLDKAGPLLEKALEGAKEKWGEAQWKTADHKIALAVLRTKEERHKEAESLFDECLEDMQQRVDDNHPELLRVKSHLGVLYREQGRYDEAEKLLSDMCQRQAQSKELGPDHPHTLESIHELAVLYARQGHHQEAEKFFVQAVEGRLVKLGDTHPHTQESIGNLIGLYEVWNKPNEAENWRAKLPQTEAFEE